MFTVNRIAEKINKPHREAMVTPRRKEQWYIDRQENRWGGGGAQTWGRATGQSYPTQNRPGRPISTDISPPSRALQPSMVANPYDAVLPPPIIRPTLLWV